MAGCLGANRQITTDMLEFALKVTIHVTVPLPDLALKHSCLFPSVAAFEKHDS